MAREKVLLFIHGLSAGGAETLVKNYMLNFNRKDFDVALLCVSHQKGSPYERELKEKGVRVIYAQDRLPFKKRLNRTKKIVNYICRYFVVRQIIRTESPDVLHYHMILGSYVKFSRPKRSTVIIRTVHSEPKKVWLCGLKGQRKDLRATKWLVKKRSLRFIVLHEAMREEINKMFSVSNSIVLKNGVSVDAIRNANDRNTIRGELGISENAFVLGHIGRFSSVKNQSFLVDVFIKIKEKNKHAFLLMIGDGADMDKVIEKLTRECLNGRYLILSNRGDIGDLLSAMDVFVLPSLYEGLPLSLIEAQIAKKPCFISDRVSSCATISNLVEKIPLDDGPDRWAQRIISYTTPKKIVVNDEEWDIKYVTKELEQIYLNLLLERDDGKK